MKKLLVIALAASALVVACGGGGSGGDDTPTPPPAAMYMKSGGFIWSAPTELTLINPTGLNSIANPTLERTASAYCSQQTCDQGGVSNCRWTNFNGEPGWRLPTFVQLQTLYAATPRPLGWTLGPTWGNGGLQLDLATGQTIIGGAGSKAHVTCVKPA